MTIEIISLKIYWANERRGIKTKQQINYNKWIDEIFAPSSNFCGKASKGYFTLYDFQRAIEYGDFLFLAFDERYEITGFAICVDSPSLNWYIWGNNFQKKHGSLEISLICSKIPGQGAYLIEEIANFACHILVRVSVQLNALKTNEKLVKYYKSKGFVSFSSRKSNISHIRMKLDL